MKRIYDSDALVRDDDPFSAASDDGDRDGHVNWTNASHALVPRKLRRVAIRVDLEVPDEPIEVGEAVPFTVRMHNRVPAPIVLQTTSPVAWDWRIDGIPMARERVDDWPPEGRDRLAFGSGERKRFERRWSGRIRDPDGTWHLVEPGDHELSVRVHAAGGDGGLSVDRSITIAE